MGLGYRVLLVLAVGSCWVFPAQSSFDFCEDINAYAQSLQPYIDIEHLSPAQLALLGDVCLNTSIIRQMRDEEAKVGPHFLQGSIPEGVQCNAVQRCNRDKYCWTVCERGSVEVDPWLAFALKFQRDLSHRQPLCQAQFLGSHNSGITAADGYGLEDDSWRKFLKFIRWVGLSNTIRTNNQWLSLTDQLNLGVRALELDTHWVEGQLRIALCGGYHSDLLNSLLAALNFLSEIFGSSIHWDTETVGCNPSFSSMRVKDQRVLSDALQEIASWMQKPENSQEFLIIYFDDQQNLQTWNKVPRLMSALTSAFHVDTIITPADFQKKLKGEWPSIHDLVSQGKRLLLVSRQDYGKSMNSLVFSTNNLGCEWQEPLASTFRGPPACTFATDTKSDQEPRFIKPTTQVAAQQTETKPDQEAKFIKPATPVAAQQTAHTDQTHARIESPAAVDLEEPHLDDAHATQQEREIVLMSHSSPYATQQQRDIISMSHSSPYATQQLRRVRQQVRRLSKGLTYEVLGDRATQKQGAEVIGVQGTEVMVDKKLGVKGEGRRISTDGGLFNRVGSCELQFGPLNCNFEQAPQRLVLDASNLHSFTECGINILAPDSFTPATAAAQVWSWAPGHPLWKPAVTCEEAAGSQGNVCIKNTARLSFHGSLGHNVSGTAWKGSSEDGTNATNSSNSSGVFPVPGGITDDATCVAISSADGLWRRVGCAQPFPTACRRDDNSSDTGSSQSQGPTWKLGYDGLGNCSDGYVFDIPRSPQDNMLLRSLVDTSGLGAVFIQPGPDFLPPSGTHAHAKVPHHKKSSGGAYSAWIVLGVVVVVIVCYSLCQGRSCAQEQSPTWPVIPNDASGYSRVQISDESTRADFRVPRGPSQPLPRHTPRHATHPPDQTPRSVSTQSATPRSVSTQSATPRSVSTQSATPRSVSIQSATRPSPPSSSSAPVQHHTAEQNRTLHHAELHASVTATLAASTDASMDVFMRAVVNASVDDSTVAAMFPSTDAALAASLNASRDESTEAFVHALVNNASTDEIMEAAMYASMSASLAAWMDPSRHATRNAARAERANASRAERGNASRAERGNASRAERGNASRAERENASRTERENASRAERENASRAERGNASRAERENASRAERENASRAERENARHAVPSVAQHGARQGTRTAVRNAEQRAGGEHGRHAVPSAAQHGQSERNDMPSAAQHGQSERNDMPSAAQHGQSERNDMPSAAQHGQAERNAMPSAAQRGEREGVRGAGVVVAQRGEWESDVGRSRSASGSNTSDRPASPDFSCPICLDECGDALMILPCQHIFHEKCVLETLSYGHRTCPLCRRSVDASDPGTVLHDH